MNKSFERKMRNMAYCNKGLSKHVIQFKKSLDEVAGVLNGVGKKKKKDKK